MRRHRGDKRPLLGDDGWSRGKTIAGIVIVFVFLLMVLNQYTDSYLTRRAFNQASAVSSLSRINKAEATYSSTYNIGFSPSLAALGPPPAGAEPSASAAGLIDSVLAGGLKSEYRFVYSPGPPEKTGHIISYSVVARPLGYLKYKGSGTHSYFTDQSRVIHQTSDNRPATAKDPPVGG